MIKRLLLSVLTLLVVSGLTFLLFFAVLRSPAEMMCGEGKSCNAAKIELITRRLHLDEPIPQQYAGYMRGIVAGREIGNRHCDAPCLGFSFHYDEPVTALIARRLPVTVSIVLGATVVQLVGGVTIGMISALRRGTAFDKVAVGVSLTGASMQLYFLGYLM